MKNNAKEIRLLGKILGRGNSVATEKPGFWHRACPGPNNAKETRLLGRNRVSGTALAQVLTMQKKPGCWAKSLAEATLWRLRNGCGQK
ncbi:hypothetical protein [Microseira sp. BLCC-F43]|jgi:hypothetical protein|uniref:hypothetical protein n=1 Tax=Microseira sp. BLCC-F43 TaxID=3153602 RepID=UPI0035BBC983